MANLESKLNALVLVLLCAAGYFVFSLPRDSVAPPDDKWFHAHVADRPEPVVVKFGADWCGPCRAMEPELDKLAGDMRDRVGVVRIDVSKHPDLARHYGVSSIPRVLLFQHGKVVADRVGYMDHQQLENWVASNAR